MDYAKVSLEKHYEYQPGDLPGKYPLTLSGKTSNNYEITFQPGEITVQRAILYATIGNVEVEIGQESSLSRKLAFSVLVVASVVPHRI